MGLARAAALVLAGLFVSAAGPYSERLSPEDLHGIKTVAVISALGNTFLFQHVTDKAFEWMGPPDSHFLEISDWALDARIDREVTAALAKRFTVEPIAFRPVDFSSWDYSLLRQSALDLNGDPAIDAYVLILRDWRPDTIGYSLHTLGGLGFYRRDATHAKFAVFASYRIVVVDTLTGDIIASRTALTPGGATLPWLAADAALWPKTQNDLTEPQRATLLADETKLIEATLPRTLAQLGLAR